MSLSNFGRTELATLETQLANDQTRLSIQLRSAEDFRLAMARYSNYISVFKPAELPVAPIGPQTMRNTGLAAVVGAMVGVGIAFLLDYLDDTIHSPEEAQRELGINALGALPKSEGVENGWIAADAPLSAIAEAFRSLRTNFQYFSLDKPLQHLADHQFRAFRWQDVRRLESGDGLCVGRQESPARGRRPAARAHAPLVGAGARAGAGRSVDQSQRGRWPKDRRRTMPFLEDVDPVASHRVWTACIC